MARVPLVLATCSLLAACSNDQPSAATPDAGTPDAGLADVGPFTPGQMTITIAGALTGSKQSHPPTTEFMLTDGPGYTIFFDPGNGPVFNANFQVGYGDRPTIGTYRSGTPAFDCSVTVTSHENPEDSWAARTGARDQPELGTCALTHDSVTPTAVGHGVQVYATHGSLTATLERRSGAAIGNLTLSARF